MSDTENPVILLAICGAVVALSILGIVGGISSRLAGSLDGLLMLGVCLMMALIFAALAVIVAKGQGWLGGRAGGPPSAAGAAK